MIVKLRVLQGKLKAKKGEAREEVRIRRSPFVIGSADDCNMRCPSKMVSPRHCEFLLDEETVTLRDLGSDTGTFVNDERIGDSREVVDGDQLRIGRLHFEVLVELPEKPKVDPVSDFVSELLVEADEEERAQRLQDPQSRNFQIKQPVGPAEDEEPEEEKKQFQRPPKKPPGKLPEPPKYVADNTIEAADEIAELTTACAVISSEAVGRSREI